MRIPILLAALLIVSLPLRSEPNGVDLVPCEPASELLCGTLTVPEDHGVPGGRTIELSIVIAPAIEPREGAAPLFILDGGPGLAATSAAEFFLDPLGREHRAGRDVVLVDQRGTGGSGALRCPALERRSPLESMFPVGLVRECREELSRRADLTRYGTIDAARDLDRVREALGHDAIDLWSVSYGTQLARQFMRLYPDRVRSAVLIGTPPADLRTPLHHSLNAHRAVELAFHACQSDAACAAAYPDVRAEWSSLLARLGREPVRVEHEGKSFELSRGIFAEALRSFLSTGAAFRRFPAIVHAAAAGDFHPFLKVIPAGSSAYSEGLYLSNVCPEGTMRIAPTEIAPATAGTWFGDYRLREQRAACEAWENGVAPDALFAEPDSNAQVLFIHGELDQVAAPNPAREACAAMPHCRFVLVPSMGHVPFDFDQWTNGLCLETITLAFYRNPDLGALDLRCLETLKPPPFQIPTP